MYYLKIPIILLSAILTDPGATDLKYETRPIKEPSKTIERSKSKKKSPPAPITTEVYIDLAKRDQEKDKLVAQVCYRFKDWPLKIKGNGEVDKEGNRSGALSLEYSW